MLNIIKFFKTFQTKFKLPSTDNSSTSHVKNRFQYVSNKKVPSHVFSSKTRLHQTMILIFNQRFNMTLYDPCYDKILVNHSSPTSRIAMMDIQSRRFTRLMGGSIFADAS